MNPDRHDSYELPGVGRDADENAIEQRTGNDRVDARLADAPDPTAAPDAGYVDFAEARVRPFETVRGSTRRVHVAAVGMCETCRGTGAAPGTSVRECAACGGAGRVRTPSLGEGRLPQIETCLACAGRGVLAERPCARCHGLGEARHDRNVEVDIPPGAEDGGVIRVGADGPAAIGARRASSTFGCAWFRSAKRGSCA